MQGQDVLSSLVFPALPEQTFWTSVCFVTPSKLLSIILPTIVFHHLIPWQKRSKEDRQAMLAKLAEMVADGTLTLVRVVAHER